MDPNRCRNEKRFMRVEDEDHFPPLIRSTCLGGRGKSGGGSGGGRGTEGLPAQDNQPFQLNLSEGSRPPGLGASCASSTGLPGGLAFKVQTVSGVRRLWEPSRLLSWAFQQRKHVPKDGHVSLWAGLVGSGGAVPGLTVAVLLLVMGSWQLEGHKDKDTDGHARAHTHSHRKHLENLVRSPKTGKYVFCSGWPLECKHAPWTEMLT